MYFRNYEDIKREIESNKHMISVFEKQGCTTAEIEEIKKEYAADLKKYSREFYKYRAKYYPDPLSVPIRNNQEKWRTVSTDGETRTDFIIIPDKWGELWESEDENDYQQISDDIEEFVFSTVGYRSCYDFPTGQLVTYSWGFHRTPVGVAVFHNAGIDW